MGNMREGNFLQLHATTHFMYFAITLQDAKCEICIAASFKSVSPKFMNGDIIRQAQIG
jgi:hypothetical protein